MAAQDDINAAVAAIDAAVTKLGQAPVTVNTGALVSATANLNNALNPPLPAPAVHEAQQGGF